MVDKKFRTKVAVFWAVAPCSLVEVYHVSEVLALQPRRQPSSYSPPWEPQILLKKFPAIYGKFHYHVHNSPPLFCPQRDESSSHVHTVFAIHLLISPLNPEADLNTVIPRFTSLIRSSKTAREAKTRKTKINFPLLPDGNNDRFARGRSSYKRKLVRKLKNRY
jgi:hypothetical protein